MPAWGRAPRMGRGLSFGFSGWERGELFLPLLAAQ